MVVAVVASGSPESRIGVAASAAGGMVVKRGNSLEGGGRPERCLGAQAAAGEPFLGSN